MEKYSVKTVLDMGNHTKRYLIIFNDCEVASSYEEYNAGLVCKLLNEHEAKKQRQKRHKEHDEGLSWDDAMSYTRD